MSGNDVNHAGYPKAWEGQAHQSMIDAQKKQQDQQQQSNSNSQSGPK